jgi:single-strand DNA-binding protein
MSYCKITLLGKLGSDPTKQKTKTGLEVSNFSVATNKFIRGNDGQEDKSTVTWHKCVCFGRQAQSCNQYLKKGTMVYLEGDISYSSYVGRDGINIQSVNVLIGVIRFLGNNGKSEPSLKQPSQGQKKYDPYAGLEEDPVNSVDDFNSSSYEELPF